MKVAFVVVPPGGGEADYQFILDLPALPHTGDYVQVLRSDEKETGYDYFIVRRRWFSLTAKDVGRERQHAFDNVVVEVEFAKGPAPTASHKESVAIYERRGKKAQEYETTAY